MQLKVDNLNKQVFFLFMPFKNHIQAHSCTAAAAAAAANQPPANWLIICCNLRAQYN